LKLYLDKQKGEIGVVGWNRSGEGGFGGVVRVRFMRGEGASRSVLSAPPFETTTMKPSRGRQSKGECGRGRERERSAMSYLR